jgi:hypothetical protein
MTTDGVKAGRNVASRRDGGMRQSLTTGCVKTAPVAVLPNFNLMKSLI